MLNFNEIKAGAIVKIADQPYVIMRTEHTKMAQRRPVVKAKLKNLVNGGMLEKSFVENEKVEEAEIEARTANYLYKTENDVYFMNNKTYEQFSVPLEQVGDKLKYLKEGADAEILYFQERPVALKLPVKMALKVTSAPPGVKGNSAGNVTKVVELETGLQINAPMFIGEGETVVVNTETGEYVGRGRQ
jgi:elongation factor P